MEKKEFMNYLERQAEYDCADGELEGKPGVYVKNNVYETETHFTDTVIAQKELVDLLKATHQGKNIEQMTRVTGYFSKTSKWNKGKKGELKDRNRVEI